MDFSKGHVTAEGTWKDGLMDGEMTITTQVRIFVIKLFEL